MTDLTAAFSAAGFANVKPILGSGNVVFDAPSGSETALARRAEAAMEKKLGRSFPTIVRSVRKLERLVAADPFVKFRLPPNAKRVVTFLRRRQEANLPGKKHGARILAIDGYHAFSAYVPTTHGPVFMTLIEKTLGKDVTTRTWDTVKKCAAA